MPRTEVFDRPKVLEKVRDLFWNKGYNGTSMQDLVETTGLNRSSFYNSFGNKLTLYKLVLKEYQEASQSIFDEALLRANSPMQAIQFIFENFIDEIINDREGKGCFSMNCKAEMGRSNEEIKSYLEKVQERTIGFFKDLVEEGQHHGIINTNETSEHYAYYLFSAFQGLRMTGMLVRDREKLQHIVGNTMQILI